MLETGKLIKKKDLFLKSMFKELILIGAFSLMDTL
jgi:hypothetical protein